MLENYFSKLEERPPWVSCLTVLGFLVLFWILIIAFGVTMIGIAGRF